MKLLHLRALFASGVLSAMFYGARGGSEREATAFGARALDHETVNTALSAQATTSTEQEDRAGMFYNFFAFLRGSSPAKFERILPDTEYIASLRIGLVQCKRPYSTQTLPPFAGESDRIVKWMAFNLFSHLAPGEPPKNSVIQIANVLVGLQPPRAALVLQHASELRGTKAWVGKVAKELDGRIKGKKNIGGHDGHRESSVRNELPALSMSFKLKETQLKGLYQRIFSQSAHESTTSQLIRHIDQQLGELPLDDAAIVVQIAKENKETRKLAGEIGKMLFAQFKRAGVSPKDLEMDWLSAASYFDNSLYGKHVKSFIDDYEKVYQQRRFKFE